MNRDQAVEMIRAVERRCRGCLPAEAREAVVRMMADGRVAEARALDANLRSGCGYDFNEIVITGPWDGQEHAYVCPQCGVEGTYLTPRFE